MAAIHKQLQHEVEEGNFDLKLKRESLEDLAVRYIQTKVSLIPYGKLLRDIREEPDKIRMHEYSVKPDKCTENIRITAAMRMIAGDILFGSAGADECNIACSFLESLNKVASS